MHLKLQNVLTWPINSLLKNYIMRYQNTEFNADSKCFCMETHNLRIFFSLYLSSRKIDWSPFQWIWNQQKILHFLMSHIDLEEKMFRGHIKSRNIPPTLYKVFIHELYTFYFPVSIAYAQYTLKMKIVKIRLENFFHNPKMLGHL